MIATVKTINTNLRRVFLLIGVLSVVWIIQCGVRSVSIWLSHLACVEGVQKERKEGFGVEEKRVQIPTPSLYQICLTEL